MSGVCIAAIGWCSRAGAQEAAATGAATEAGLGGAPAPTSEAAEAAPEADAATLAGAKILAVDDDEMVRGAVARILSDWGCIVETAGSPSEALSRIDLDGFRPDLLLIDYNLGAPMDGIALVATIGQHLPKRPPAILVTV